jgi:hypothetical protein
VLGLDLDYQQTNEQKLFSIRIAICQVYLEPNVLRVVGISISGKENGIFDFDQRT